jgi:hypothetical protein
MKRETTYTLGAIDYFSCWSDLEIKCQDGTKVMIPMSMEEKERLHRTLAEQLEREKKKQLENLKNELDPVEEIPE